MSSVLQLNARLEETESRTTERISELETQLMQATKEVALLKVSSAARKRLCLTTIIILAWCGILQVISQNEKSL